VAGLSAFVPVVARPAASAASGVVRNGQERWPVKTLSDLDVSAVPIDPPQIQETTVKAPAAKEADDLRSQPETIDVIAVKSGFPRDVPNKAVRFAAR
jgi:hypothetical protein